MKFRKIGNSRTIIDIVNYVLKNGKDICEICIDISNNQYNLSGRISLLTKNKFSIFVINSVMVEVRKYFSINPKNYNFHFDIMNYQDMIKFFDDLDIDIDNYDSDLTYSLIPWENEFIDRDKSVYFKFIKKNGDKYILKNINNKLDYFFITMKVHNNSLFLQNEYPNVKSSLFVAIVNYFELLTKKHKLIRSPESSISVGKFSWLISFKLRPRINKFIENFEMIIPFYLYN